MRCRKCGAELHPEQRACIQCGELTPAGGKFDVEKERVWRPSPMQIKIAGGVLGLVILIYILYRVLHVVPPEVVAGEWFEDMLSRSYAAADKCITPKFEQYLSSRMMDLRALSDMWIEDIASNEASYEVGAPTFDNPGNPRTARITIIIKSPDDQILRQVLMDMRRIGRRWMIDRAE